MADGFERKRAPSVTAAIRPTDPAPPATATLNEREDWAERFVWWFLSVTGGDPEVEGVPAGHRWRIEYFECVRDPQAYQHQAEYEIAVCGLGGK